MRRPFPRGRVQYRPFGKALQAYAGERNKKALIRLLGPVHRASEKVAFVKEMVDSGDIFHPLAWTPGEAYRLLKNVPILEEIGHNWLWFLSRLGLGACLADDMGSGKTVQILSVLSALKEKKTGPFAKPSLLVLPASLLANWKAEIARFAPALATVFIHPSETEKATLAALAEKSDVLLAGTDLVLTTYGMLLRQKWLSDVAWRLVIMDEAQAVKNPAARQTKAVKKLKADARIALTGTPVENRLGDLWSLYDFLCPGLLGLSVRFKKFVKVLENREHDRYAPLRKLVGPYILRRLKTDKRIITDLPDKTEMKAFCGLTKKQVKLYTQSVKTLAATLDGLDGMQRRGLVLAYLMRFKQICNHPQSVSRGQRV